MYLSCLLVDTGDNPDRPRPGRLWLPNRYHVHQRLCMAFPSATRKEEDTAFLQPYCPDSFPQVHAPRTTQQAFLFRIDPLPVGRAMIVVQSAGEPDWNYAFQNASYLLACPPKVWSYEPQFQNGQRLRFRLAANPARRLRKDSIGPDGKRVRPEWVGKRVPVGRDAIEAWLAEQGKENGFMPLGSFEDRSLSLETGYVAGFKSKHQFGPPEGNGRGDRSMRFFSARFDGILQVSDAEKLREAVITGIGPAKGFGFGLLSLAPLRE